MKSEELLELAKKLGMNIPATENWLKTDIKVAEVEITKAAKFMGLVK